MLDEEAINSYLRAGKISAEVKKRARSFVKEGMSMLELAEKIENEIKELGGSLAFPVNLSIGSIAAHFSPLTDSQDKITKNGILKIDIGVHVNGYIADTAFSIDMDGENEDLVKAAEEAVNRVKESIYPGVKISQISEILEKTIKSYGAVPIRNLTGHGLDRYKLHTGINIPSVTSLMIRGSIPPNSAVAIEPFATKGAGYVTEGDIVGIYSLKSIPSKKLKNLGSDAKTLYEKIYRERGELPFSERWYSSSVGVSNFRRLMRELTLNGISQYYPILVEVTGSQVAQFEESFLLLDKEVIVYTEEK
ncbi:MAG: type II methionyl aminopeptidase [Fervidicoccaceae archaeon]|jgi:methionyl aminopeptidase|nr:MAG: type II methionyl aminopeptidase [Fervidicoccus fontis]